MFSTSLPRVRGRRLVAAVVLILIATGCAASTSAEGVAPTPVLASELAEMEPAPTDLVLTAVGIDGSTTEMSVADIEDIGLIRVTVLEPFLGEEVVFEGVSIGEFLDAIAAAGVALPELVEIHALDDYRYDFGVERLSTSGALVATRNNGHLLPLDEGGPIRLVFPPTSAEADDKAAWVWSIDRIGPTD